jgi:hypothetical protein
MAFASIMRTWKDSIQFFTTKQALLLLFASIQTVKRTVKYLVKSFWWLLAIEFFVYIASVFPVYDVMVERGESYLPISLNFFGFVLPLDYELPEAPYLVVLMATLLFFSIKIFLSLFTVLAARPSLDRKQASYFYDYARQKIGGFILLFISLGYILYIFPLPWLSSFFFIDDDQSGWRAIGKAVRNSIMMIILFLPVMALLWFFEWGYYRCASVIVDLIARFTMMIIGPSKLGLALVVGSVSFLAVFGGWIVLLSLVLTCYVKIKHGYYEVFFGSSTQKKDRTSL